MSKLADFTPRCLRHSMFFMNFLFWVLGVFIAGVGMHVHVDHMRPIQDLVNSSASPALIMMVLGSALFIVATVGCIGAIRENLDFLKVYALALLLLLMVHIASGVISFLVLFFNTTVKDGAEDILRESLLKYKENDRLSDFLSGIQVSMKCCGIDGYRDWSLNPYYQCEEDNINPDKCSVPASCCKHHWGDDLNLMCGYRILSDTASDKEASLYVHTKGCVIKIEELLQSVAMILGVVSFGVAVSLLCGMLLTVRMIQCLQKSVDNYFRKYRKRNGLLHTHVIPDGHIYHMTEPKTTNILRPPLST